MQKATPYILGFALILLALIFVFVGSGFDFNYVIPKRLIRLVTIILGGICVAISSIIFQTLVSNRILTPAIMGYEAVYLLWQALLLLIGGTYGLVLLGSNGNFMISLILMLLYSWLIQRYLLSKDGRDVYLLLLFGLVFSIVIGTLTQFVQLRISPGEFSVFQGLSYASFNRASPEILIYSCIAVCIVLIMGLRNIALLDVLALGREQSISLGIDHAHYLKFYLALIAILVAVSTSLIGPTAFMGVFIANMTYALVKTQKHRITLAVGCGLAIIVFLIAQILVEHFFNYKTTVSILVNLVCGIYFLTLMVRTRGVA
ncbi:iron chelate uptake ABC transporter family permease subunit [Acinetobacter wuhouensis]|uniref:Iron ABC transporter permease n=1 Tax=Acinetobacter wuhouensis TaxID=1879050 RepID=A0A3G2T0K7_9GAMM|nr:iron chelate uptake ABC transporter family permease subunit [Acinetobacter wuhouensis]AYO53668.1 iron ABC transporter permease [Acinetobacter wuhouensis]